MRALGSWCIRSLLGLGLLVGGVASGASEPPAIAVHLPYRSYNLQLLDEDVLSPELQLHRSATELTGRAFGAATKLSLKEQAASGIIGARAVNLKVRKEGDTLHAEGGFIGGRVTLRFSPKELHVYITQCRYELTYTEGKYVGRRSCDSLIAPPVELSVPEGFQQLGSADQAVLLLLALSDPDRV